MLISWSLGQSWEFINPKLQATIDFTFKEPPTFKIACHLQMRCISWRNKWWFNCKV